MSLSRASTVALAAAASLVLAVGCGGDGGGGGGMGPNEAPSASIDSPSDGAAFSEDASVTFEGSASDPEDGALSGEALEWSSDVDGDLGTGETLTVQDLTPDVHTVVLVATDSDGATDSDSVTVDTRGLPDVTISAPADDSLFTAGDDVALEGSATDETDGALTGGSLQWSSDLDGDLGTGESATASALSAGSHTIFLTATDSDGNSATDSVHLLAEQSGFQVQIRFASDLTASERSTVRDAMAPWEAAITGDLAPAFLSDSLAASCRTGGKGIDDLLAVVEVESIDGPNGVLAQAGPCSARTNTAGDPTTPLSGIVTIDEADLGNSQLEEVVTHEVGHVLGIGIEPLVGWGSNANTSNSLDPFFTGSATVSAFDGLGGEAYLSDGVPLANAGGQGTAGAHWREDNFATELMTGFINAGVDNPLSRVSLASLEDLGFAVDLSTADAYSLPMPQPALWLVDADATMSRDASSGVNYGQPDDGDPGGSIVVGTNNDETWTTDPEGEIFTGLLRFDVPSVPAGVTITGDTLLLTAERVDSTSTGHDVEALRVTGDWTEDGVTWDSRPSADSTVLVSFPADELSVAATSTALRDLARDWGDGSAGNFGLALRAPDAATDSTFSVGYDTRHENAAMTRPRLKVLAETSSSIRGALRGPGDVDLGERIPMIDDIRRGPLYLVGPDGRLRRVLEIR